METLKLILPWVQVVVSVLLVAGILLQQSEAGLGGAFGFDSSGGSFHTKRGLEKALFIATIVVAILFIVLGIVALLLK